MTACMSPAVGLLRFQAHVNCQAARERCTVTLMLLPAIEQKLHGPRSSLSLSLDSLEVVMDMGIEHQHS